MFPDAVGRLSRCFCDYAATGCHADTTALEIYKKIARLEVIIVMTLPRGRSRARPSALSGASHHLLTADNECCRFQCMPAANRCCVH